MPLPRKKNTSCAYTGLVGMRMSAKVVRPNRSRPKTKVHLAGGPLDGALVSLSACSDRNTATLAPLKGFTAGRYESGKWTPT